MKKNILLLAEKNGLIKRFLETDDFINYNLKNNVTIAYSFGITPYIFNYPKNIPYSQYPLVKNPEFKLKNEPNKNIYPEENKFYWFYKNSFDDVANKKYDEIIVICDCDHTGVFGSDLVLSKNISHNWKNEVKNYYPILVRNPDTIKNNFNKQVVDNDLELINKNKKEFDKILIQGEIKRYFDYNYNLNSQVFFNEILKSIYEKNNLINKKHKNITITKYMVLTLYIISKIDEKIKILDSTIVKRMINYKGSGKFDNGYLGIGTPPSYFQIFKNLVDLNLIEEYEKNIYTNSIYRMSFVGKEFLKLLNKKMIDPDINFRIYNWMDKPKEEALEKINTYLNTQFSSQKRKNKYLKMI